MKKFLTDNWRKIIIIIGIVFLVFDIYNILTTKNTIADDYYKYGPSPSSDIIDRVQDLDLTAVSGETQAVSEQVANNTGISLEFSHIVVVFAVLFGLLLVLDNVMKGPEKKK